MRSAEVSQAQQRAKIGLFLGPGTLLVLLIVLGAIRVVGWQIDRSSEGWWSYATVVALVFAQLCSLIELLAVAWAAFRKPLLSYVNALAAYWILVVMVLLIFLSMG